MGTVEDWHFTCTALWDSVPKIFTAQSTTSSENEDLKHNAGTYDNRETLPHICFSVSLPLEAQVTCVVACTRGPSDSCGL